MNYTVNKLAKLSGVTIRTLRFYDEIGLLKPAYVADNGYRYYQEKQLLILQQILFFRELGFELKQIQEILKQNDFDKLTALESHKKVLKKNIARMQELMKTIDNTINHLQGKRTIMEKELFKGFEPDSEQQKKYAQAVEEYLVQKYGKQEYKTIASGYKTAHKDWTKDDWSKVRKEGDELCKELVVMLTNNLKPGSKEVQAVISKHLAILNKFWTPTKETYAGHADFIMETELRKFYDAYHPKLAQFLADAIKIYASTTL